MIVPWGCVLALRRARWRTIRTRRSWCSPAARNAPPACHPGANTPGPMPQCQQVDSSAYYTHPFNGPLSRTTWVSRYQKGKPIWILLKQETVSGSGISWAIRKSAPCSRQITTPAPHYSVFTGQMTFLPPNQQCQSTEGNSNAYYWTYYLIHALPTTTMSAHITVLCWSKKNSITQYSILVGSVLHIQCSERSRKSPY